MNQTAETAQAVTQEIANHDAINGIVIAFLFFAVFMLGVVTTDMALRVNKPRAQVRLRALRHYPQQPAGMQRRTGQEPDSPRHPQPGAPTRPGRRREVKETE